MADPLEDARKGTLAPVYILISAQPLLLERAVSALRAAAVEPATAAFNLDVIDGKGASASAILAIADTLPMMAPRRMLLIRDIHAMAAAELGQLVGYLDRPNPTTVLVATASKVDKRIKFFATAKKKKVLIELEPPRRVEGFIEQELAGRGIRMERPAIRRLADVVGKDLSRLALAVDQLALYAGDRAITVEDVEDLIADTRERSVFELTDAIGDGDRARALAAVAALCDQRQSAIGVIAMLARHMRQIALTVDGLARRLPKAQMVRHVGVPPFVVDKLGRQARRHTADSAARALAMLAEADRVLKGGRAFTKTLGRDLSERVILERTVTALMSG